MFDPIIRKLKKHKIYSSFKQNIHSVADLADMWLKNKYHNGIRSKYPRIILLKYEKVVEATKAPSNILFKSN